MKPILSVELATEPLERVRADVLVVGVAPTDRPLRGAAGYADWRLCGQLWKMVSDGRILGIRGEASLVIPGRGFQSDLLLVLGLGPRRSLDVAAWRELARDATDRSIGLRAETLALAILQDADLDRPTQQRPDELNDATEGLVQGAADALEARAASLRLSLIGASSAIFHRTPVPAGVEVHLPGSRTSKTSPSPLASPQAAATGFNSRSV